MGYIGKDELRQLAARINNQYGDHLLSLLEDSASRFTA
jgi:hypothetical protein